jgi:hypothetical protein
LLLLPLLLHLLPLLLLLLALLVPHTVVRRIVSYKGR